MLTQIEKGINPLLNKLAVNQNVAFNKNVRKYFISYNSPTSKS